MSKIANIHIKCSVYAMIEIYAEKDTDNMSGKSFAKYVRCAQHSFLHILRGNGTKLATSCRLWLNVCLKNRKSPNILFSSSLYNKNILQNINVVLQAK